jgi:hypothetical protein
MFRTRIDFMRIRVHFLVNADTDQALMFGKDDDTMILKIVYKFIWYLIFYYKTSLTAKYPAGNLVSGFWISRISSDPGGRKSG